MSQSVQPVFDILRATEIRERSGKSYADLATALGMTRQGVGHWFRGRGEPDVQQLKLMAKEMGCHWLELVTEDTKVLYQKDEIDRLERERMLTPEEKAELDAFIAFKLSTRAK